MKIYQCYKTGEIKAIPADGNEWGYSLMQFCVVEKYDSLYEKELVRFGENTPYALPGKNKSIRVYKGIDREPWRFTPDDMDRYSEEDVLKYYRSLNNEDTELLFYRMAGYDSEKPEGLSFLGYDAGYLFGEGNGDGFSVICDCMFLSRWHGCDYEGTEFIKEFQKLNKNGLFDSEKDTIDYLYHYLKQDWAETGDFCIFEIYEPVCGDKDAADGGISC